MTEPPQDDWLQLVSDCAEWDGALDAGSLARRAAAQALAVCGLNPARVEISLLLTDDAAMAALNGRFRDKQEPTNVLSWPSVVFDPPADATALERRAPGAGGARLFLGDVALAFQTTRQEALDQGKPLEEHAAHLIVHGVLHLLGHDHQDEDQAASMQAREIEALQRMGVASPYRADGLRNED